MSRSLLTPRWILSHVLVGVLVVVMIIMGLWQLDRRSSRIDRNAEVTDRIQEPVEPIGALAAVDDPFSVGEGLRYRLATATGTFQAEDEVLVRNRTFNGEPGYWAITPLLLGDGTAVAVNRGWVPRSPGPDEPRPDSAPPTGTVTITGMVLETVTAEGIQRDDPDTGVLASLARVDLARLAQQVDYRLLPVQLQMETQSPASIGTLPVVLERPDLDEGPHLSYAVQWLVFTTIAIVGYPLVLRRVAASSGQSGRRHRDVPEEYLVS